MEAIMGEIKPEARQEPEWTEDNPKLGSVAYLALHPEEAGRKDTARITVDIRISNSRFPDRETGHRTREPEAAESRPRILDRQGTEVEQGTRGPAEDNKGPQLYRQGSEENRIHRLFSTE